MAVATNCRKDAVAAEREFGGHRPPNALGAGAGVFEGRGVGKDVQQVRSHHPDAWHFCTFSNIFVFDKLWMVLLFVTNNKLFCMNSKINKYITRDLKG